MNDDARDRVLRALAPQLRILSVVAEHEHVSQAAERLGIPQPTVSRSLARLQRDLGIPVLERTGRGVRLTRAGRALLPWVRRAVAELQDGVSQLVGPASGRITLAFLPTLGAEAVPALIGSFRSEYPEVQFALHQLTWAEAVRQLRTGDVDLVLTSPPPAEPGLTTHVLHTQPLRLVVPYRHRLAARSHVRLADIGTDSLIALKPGRGVRHLTDDLYRRSGLVPRIAFEGDDIPTARGLVAAGLGVAVLPPQPGGAHTGTVEIGLDEPGAVRRVGVAWRSEEYEPPSLATFRAFVLTEGPRLVATGLR
ncbi:LysR family transcriptional regulator [Lipingzhangella sp. LS1_29]|uniref:LysR family transcriptional regulator n=1 Tax=Lipingzhangella rawalii TaxID=2055835 RepID=A0ABU2HCP5_9ACTN|nr:LysR family transcriptional regulator [Lipingzhangella rawalii]MDS1272610.1 LysR family transcriptional regulator [Lipingzhangella rawalii]